jgi:hypothetical protein
MKTLLDEAVPVVNCKASQIQSPDFAQRWHFFTHLSQPQRLEDFPRTLLLKAFNLQQ